VDAWETAAAEGFDADEAMRDEADGRADYQRAMREDAA
jgi:hypothetical protein